MRDVPLDQLAPYACEDADIAFRLYELFTPALREGGVEKIAREVEFPLVPVLADMEQAGIIVRDDILREISTAMTEELVGLQIEIFRLAGGEFNIGSPIQLGEVLFDRLSLPVISKTSTGKPSHGSVCCRSWRLSTRCRTSFSSGASCRS